MHFCEPVGLARRLVGAPARDPRKAQRNTRFVPAGAADTIEGELEHLLRHDLPYRPEALDRVAPDPPVQGENLRIAQAGTSLGDRYQRVVLPDREGIVGEQIGAAIAARLRVHHDRVDPQPSSR